MTDELVHTTDAMMAPDGVTLERATRTLHEVFGPLLDADYVTGKTVLRDALAERFTLSQLEAEDLCDELEQSARVRFVRTADGAAWHIHAEEGRA